MAAWDISDGGAVLLADGGVERQLTGTAHVLVARLQGVGEPVAYASSKAAWFARVTRAATRTVRC